MPGGPPRAVPPAPKVDRRPYTWRKAVDGPDHRAGPLGNHLETGEAVVDTSRARWLDEAGGSGRAPAEGLLALTDRRLIFARTDQRRPTFISRDDITGARAGWARSPGLAELRIETWTGSRYLFHTGKQFARSAARILSLR